MMARNRTQNLKAPTPVLAVIGVGDLAVEKIREVSSDVQARSSKMNLEPKQLQADFEAAAKHRVDDVRAAQNKAQQRAESVFNDVVAQATTTYDSLAGRGQKLVNRILRQQSTQQAKRAASTTKSQAKAASTTARKGAASTGSSARRSASQTRSTAKKSASQTQSRAKAASTSARKTAESTGQAASQAAQKVGDEPQSTP
jgi:heparin binding hemagglutinin HbhA